MPFLTEEELRERTMGVERVPGDAAAEEVTRSIVPFPLTSARGMAHPRLSPA